VTIPISGFLKLRKKNPEFLFNYLIYCEILIKEFKKPPFVEEFETSSLNPKYIPEIVRPDSIISSS